MKLRRATGQDAGKLSIVGIATFLENFANDHDGDEVVSYLAATHSPDWYARTLRDPDVTAWIVEEAAGCPVGYAMLAPAGLPGADCLSDVELKRIYMLSRWHGRGFGGQLYDSVEAEARTRGARRLLLSVYVENHPAQRFYTARGFERIGRWTFEGFAASEDYVMAKVLRRAETPDLASAAQP